jgi:hypothetical protein
MVAVVTDWERAVAEVLEVPDGRSALGCWLGGDCEGVA